MIIKNNKALEKYTIGIFCVLIVMSIVVAADSIGSGNIDYCYIPVFCILEILLVYGVIVCLKECSWKCVLNEKGYEIYGWRGYHKTVSWEEVKSKYIVYAKDGEPIGMIKGVAVLSTRSISEKSIWYNPLKYTSVYHIAGIKDIIFDCYRPRNIVYIWLRATPQECNEDGSWFYDKVDERAFKQKMTEWHVELEDNKPEEIPPWKEQL